MQDLPVRFPRDPWCRAGSRLMLTLDETGACYLGLTPDGVQPGRDMLARLSLWRGEEELTYRAAQENGAMVLRAEGGFVRLGLGFPEWLCIGGEGVSLLIGKGFTPNVLMGGGSAVDDPLPGAVYVNSGARMRILPKTGSVEVRSAWDLNALSDPNPRVFLHPDAHGTLEAGVYVTDFDESPAEADTPDAAEDFEHFLRSLTAYPADDETLHAAYVAWTCLQPARQLAAPQISGPLYVMNRRTLGTARLSDNVLLSALLADPAEAARQMCSFLPYLDENGLLPREINNRSRLYEAETPYFGVVLSDRPDILEQLGETEYLALARALDWWVRERWCDVRQIFYYLHRYEPGCGAKQPFADVPPEFTPELNVCMRLWLDAMALLAERLGRPDEAAAYRERAAAVTENLRARLWTGERWQYINILDQALAVDRGGGIMTALLPELADLRGAAPQRIPRALLLPLLLAGDEATKKMAAKYLRRSAGELTSLRGALTVLAAGLAGKGAF